MKVSEAREVIQTSSISFAIISAEILGVTDAENARRDQALWHTLTTRGYNPQRCEGMWEGMTERSYFIPTMHQDSALTLGRHFDQTCVIVDGLFLYMSGESDPYNPARTVFFDPNNVPALPGYSLLYCTDDILGFSLVS